MVLYFNVSMTFAILLYIKKNSDI